MFKRRSNRSPGGARAGRASCTVHSAQCTQPPRRRPAAAGTRLPAGTQWPAPARYHPRHCGSLSDWRHKERWPASHTAPYLPFPLTPAPPHPAPPRSSAIGQQRAARRLGWCPLSCPRVPCPSHCRRLGQRAGRPRGHPERFMGQFDHGATASGAPADLENGPKTDHQLPRAS